MINKLTPENELKELVKKIKIARKMGKNIWTRDLIKRYIDLYFIVYDDFPDDININ
jgi:hypothetical protein